MGVSPRGKGFEHVLLGGDELLAAVDVVGSPGERSVGHDVNGDRADIRADRGAV
jgi:hypothetical protein